MKRVYGAVLTLVLLAVLCIPLLWAGATEVVVFTDPVLEARVREQMGKPEGDITAEDAMLVDQLVFINESEGISDDQLIHDIASLAYFKNLFVLALINNNITDISALAEMPGLKFLDLGGNNISDLSPLSGLPLEELVVWGNQISDVTPLGGLTTLKRLHLDYNQIADFSPIAGLTGLKSLYVNGNATQDFTPLENIAANLDEKDFEILTTPFSSSEVVLFRDTVLEAMVREQIGKPEGAIAAADAANVRELNLEMNPDDRSIPRISNLDGMQYFVNLITLDLGWALEAENMQVDLAPLSGLTKLERLTLQCDGIRDISALSGLTNLRELWIWVNDISDISILAGMTQMESVWIFGNQISDISVLANMPNLYRVLMADNRVTDLSPLAGLNNLTTLELQNNPIWDYTEIASMYPQLMEKDFDINDAPAYNRPENPEEVIVFNDPVLENRIREALGKPEGDITAGDAAMLEWLNADAGQNTPDSERIYDVSALRYFVNLQGLNLNSNAIQDISPLAGLTNLQHLWLEGNPINDLEPLSGLTKMISMGFDSGFREITFLQNMPDLEELRIDGLRELPADLAQLQKLRTFCSLGGELTDISVLSQIPTLTAIDVSWNMVSDLTPLQNLPLTELYLQGNPIEDFTPIRELYPNLLGRNFEYYELKQPENPDEVITFPDPVLEQKVRAAIGKPEGDITAGDAAEITRLEIGNEWQPQIPREIQVTNLQGIEYFINLRDLSAWFNAISDISALSVLSELRNLDLGGNAIGDITALSVLTNLESITLFGGSFSDISPLASLTMLQSLHLGGIPLYDISALAELTRINHLYMDGCGIADISPLAGMTNMYRLYLSDNYISDLSPLAGMINLSILNLANNPIQDYTPIQDIYPNLQEKDFEIGQVFDVAVPLKPDQPEEPIPIADAALEAILRKVTGVYDRPITQLDAARIGKITGNTDSMWQSVIDITALQYCLNLEVLSLFGSQVQDLTPLSGLSRLLVLAVNDSRVSDLSPLSGLTQLLYLELRGNQITEITALGSLVDLEGLDVSGNQIADFSPLYGFKRLGKLRINYNPAKDVSGLTDIAKGLKDKDFDPNQPLEQNRQNGGNGEDGQPERQPMQVENPDKVIVFADAVLELRVRKQIDKPQGDITAGDAALVDYLDLNNEYQESYADGSQFLDLNGIEYFINLRHLDISWNIVEDIGKLAGLTNLEYLKAFGNRISDITPLAGLTRLNNLNIGENTVTDIGALEGLQNLAELYLSGNPIEDFSPIKAIYPQLTQKDFILE